jgi:hypothetical protein
MTANQLQRGQSWKMMITMLHEGAFAVGCCSVDLHQGRAKQVHPCCTPYLTPRECHDFNVNTSLGMLSGYYVHSISRARHRQFSK